MIKPDDIRASVFWHVEQTPNSWTGYAVANPDAYVPGCRVYWGSHGCHRPAGHNGDHWCDCCECENHPDEGGCLCVAGPPYYGPDTRFYGDDVTSATGSCAASKEVDCDG